MSIKFLHIFISVGLLTVPLYAKAENTGAVKLYRITQGARILDYWVPEVIAARQPKWEPTQSTPPLSTAQAITAARQTIEIIYPDLKGIPLSEISYRRSGSRDFPFWYYDVRFAGRTNEALPYAGLQLPVLLDGSVVIPRLDTTMFNTPSVEGALRDKAAQRPSP